MASEKIFRVSEFNAFVNTYLNQVGEVVVEGEISEINVNQNQWLFITIKDKESSVEVFSTIRKISGYDLLEQGMLVHIYGTPCLYRRSGRFSIHAEQIIPAGEGALRLAFEKLKLKLEKEGLFDPQRKRPLPAFPEKIGFITARDSRAYSDFVKCLKERMGGLKIYFYPVNVQGESSVDSIVGAFNYFNNNRENFDVLVLARGGGSLEDLQPFNDERVARAIFSSKVPVVCGIGHEKDISIADLVADMRASTPSNAAEMIVKNRIEIIKEINFNSKILETNLRQLLRMRNEEIFKNVSILKDAISQEISSLHGTIGKFSTKFVLFAREVTSFIQQVSMAEKQLARNADLWIVQRKTSLDSLIRLLENLDPYRVLERGFSITMNKNGSVLKSTRSIKNGESIITTLFDGRISSQVSGAKSK